MTTHKNMPDPNFSRNSASAFMSRYASYLTGLLENLDIVGLESASRLLSAAYREGRSIYCLGNGGSAATASHFATDLAWGRRIKGETRPRAISLCANVPLMTALSNDLGYESVFVEQLKGLLQPGDVVVAISASGNSENVVQAVQYANEHSGNSVGLVGFDGGKLKSQCHACIHVETPAGMYELVEDVHHAVCHMLSGHLKLQTAQYAASESSL